MLRDIVFTLPLVLWVLIAAAATVISVRVLTAWLQIDEEGFELRGLGRPTVKAVWSEVGQVIAVRDIERGSSATEMLDRSEERRVGKGGTGRWEAEYVQV